MRFGINTFLFDAPFTTASSRRFPQYKAWGFDSVEIAIEKIEHIDPIKVKAKLDEAGLVCGSATPCLGPDKDLRGTAQQQRAGIKLIGEVMKHMTLLGCNTMIGVVYSTVGRAEAVEPKERRQQWRTVVKNLKEVCKRADDLGCTIAMEPINRYETDFINTCDQGLEMIHDVNSRALKLLLDTFHMNIEEKNSADAIRRAGKHLGHFHACGCDRGTPGNDHIDWKPIAAALKAIDYRGDVVIESFTSDVKVIARAASIWRKMEPTREEIASKGVAFLKKLLK
jgi:D-psicose/D-tagatose/L-ribulose 3-epimerase